MVKVVMVLLLFGLTSCGYYLFPKVYRYNTIPYDVEVPIRKNIKQNKYNKNNPYYEKVTTKDSVENK